MSQSRPGIHRRAAAAAAVAALALAGCADADEPAAAGSAETSTAAEGGMDMDDDAMDGDNGGGSGGMAMGGAPACPEPPTLDAVPERVVTLDTGAAAILVELGVGEKVVGTSGTDFSADFDGEVRTALDAIPVLNERVANRETVIAAEPDLVTGVSVYQFGAFDGTATVEQLEQVGAAALVACDITDGEANTGIDDTYDYIDDLGAAFRVPELATAIVDDMRQQVTDATAEYADDEPVRVLTLSSAPEGGQGINTSGGASMANGIVTLAGGENIAADVTTDFAQLSTEVVTERDPQAIVAVGGIGGASTDELVEAIRSSSVLAGTTAIREDRIVAVEQTALLSPSLANAKTVDAVAAGIHTPAP